MDQRLPRHLMAMTASCLVLLTCSHQNDWIIIAGGSAVNQPLTSCGRCSAYCTHRCQFCNEFRMCKQLRHDTERLPAKIHVQPGNHDTLSMICKIIAYLYNLFIEKLYLIDCNYIIAIIYVIKNLMRTVYHCSDRRFSV